MTTSPDRVGSGPLASGLLGPTAPVGGEVLASVEAGLCVLGPLGSGASERASRAPVGGEALASVEAGLRARGLAGSAASGASLAQDDQLAAVHGARRSILLRASGGFNFCFILV